MKKILSVCLVLFSLIAQKGYSQVGSACAQTLRLARSAYEQGRLHELQNTLQPCLDAGDKGFSKSERVEAYKLLTLSYIYLEEPALADAAMLGLLNTDHFFEINNAVDPAEFVALYKKFRTKSLFKIGVRLGANGTFATPTNIYSVTSGSEGKGKFTTLVGTQFGLALEKDFFKSFVLAPEFMYVLRSYGYTNPTIFVNDSSGASAADAKNVFKQTRVDINIIAQYKFNSKNPNFTPYVGIGPGFSYLLSSKGPLITNGGGGKFVVSGPDVDLSKSFNQMMYSAIVVAGMKYKVGGIYLQADIRYQYGIGNVINPAHRTNPQAAFDYGAPMPDHRIANVAVNFGFLYPFFKPKKLIN